MIMVMLTQTAQVLKLIPEINSLIILVLWIIILLKSFQED